MNIRARQVPEGMRPQDRLEQLTWRGAQWRYPGGVSPDITALLKKELAMIDRLDIARYFLTTTSSASPGTRPSSGLDPADESGDVLR